MALGVFLSAFRETAAPFGNYSDRVFRETDAFHDGVRNARVFKHDVAMIVVGVLDATFDGNDRETRVAEGDGVSGISRPDDDVPFLQLGHVGSLNEVGHSVFPVLASGEPETVVGFMWSEVAYEVGHQFLRHVFEKNF